jgi:hypothetical protein
LEWAGLEGTRLDLDAIGGGLTNEQAGFGAFRAGHLW